MNNTKMKMVTMTLLATGFVMNAQDINQAAKAVDAEKYDTAKTMLKSIIQSNENDGRAAYLLGREYLREEKVDSAKIYFDKGLAAGKDNRMNYIGLGQIELNKNNIAAAVSNFDQATQKMRRKDTEELVYVARAYMNADKPNYNKAIEVLNKAKMANPEDAQVYLALGDAYYGLSNQNEAYSNYRNAFRLDDKLLRAKMQLGVLLKGAKAYNEAIKSFNEVIAIDKSYGPVYRELAETYYKWGANDKSKFDANIKIALGFYDKYMSLTDYSLDSRMRHADFLILARDYKALEQEAIAMQKLDKVNPRIKRYLGYAAYENGNTDLAISSLNEYISNPANKIIGRDYLYLGLAKIKKSSEVEGKTDTAMYEKGIADIRKAVELEPTTTADLNQLGQEAYTNRDFNKAAAIFEIATSNPQSPNFLIDNLYLGNSIYYANTRKDVVKVDKLALEKADKAFGNVITASPTTADAYIFRARTNKLLEKDEMMAQYYEDFLKVVKEKGPEEMEANKVKAVEAYNNIGAHYANSDKTKAIEYFNKALALDPANNYATQSIQSLK
ncbi:tetratricopeptide repeat protein [Flavobacterium ardleyense]|uniref:tetratricopeptide repeat protein n=1 Tax=Flavobacterium ardleyense TaxID=2038737 RepID=UPI00298CB628|nr:tetratricopeptide repeat protein [Flavobacterium ardleyense]